MGRQPWVVYGLLKTSDARSPDVSMASIIISLTGYIVVYGVLIAVGARLFLREIRTAPRSPATPGPAGPARPARPPATSYWPTEMHDPNFLQTLWFVLIGVLWVGYFVLEGFDFGVGILLRVIGRDNAEKRAIIHTIGPVWDGNEVWLLTAGGATFAAFPGWYASLFSGFYLALFLILDRADHPRRLVRVLGQGRLAALARDVGVDDRRRQLHGGAAVGRRLGRHRPRRPDERRSTTSRPRSGICCTPTRCSAGSSR